MSETVSASAELPPTAVRPTAPHRLRRYRSIYHRLVVRVRGLGGSLRLCALDGAVLAGEPADGLIPPVDLLPRTSADRLTLSRTTAHDATGLWLPLGNGQIDALLLITGLTEHPESLVQTLEWSVRDADRLAQLEDGTAQLGDRLAENYEQMHVLFDLGRLLDGVDDVHAGVERVLDKVRTGLPFPWVGVQFGQHPRLRPEVAGKFLLSGNSTCPADDIQAVCADLLRHHELTGLRMIFPGDPLGSHSEKPGYADQLQTELAAVPVRYEGETVAILLAGEKGGEDAAISSFETQFLAACTDLLSVFHENLTRFADQRSLFIGTVRALTSSIDAKHRYTRGHSDRVALLAREMARAMNLGEAAAQTYHLAGLLHDVGKIGVPEAILSKPTRLTDAEFEIIKLHPRTGYEILRDIPHLEEVLPGVLHHHEAFGGGGYPDGLIGDEIPLIGRVLALCDTFDAMSSSRSYRESLSRETVLAEIRRCSGKQFDPALAEIFLGLDFASFDTLFGTHSEQLTLAA